MKHFSDFAFDLCYDFTFWKPKTERCIPKEMNDYENSIYYPFPPLCNRTEFDCTEGSLQKYCPNVDEHCDQYENFDEKPYFLCNESKTCIPNGNNFTDIYTDQITQ